MKYYLAHHGVPNQHWGVRHGPPYPLDSNASKQAKRKSASKSSYNKLYGDKKGSTSHTGSVKTNNKSAVSEEIMQIVKKNILPNALANTATFSLAMATNPVFAVPIWLASHSAVTLGSATIGAINAKKSGNSASKAAIKNGIYAAAPTSTVIGYKVLNRIFR